MQLKSGVLQILRRAFPKAMHARAISHLQWSEVEEDLLPLLVDRDREAVDVGANVGRYTILLSRICRYVHAYEPDAELSGFLRRAAPANVSVSSDAVSDGERETEFHIPLADDGSPMVALASLEDGHTGEVRTESRRVKTTTLDRLADRDIGFIKIDVEGHELEALRGAQELLRRQQPVLLVEIEERHRTGAIQFVRELVERQGYAGLFIFEGKTHPIEAYTADMQDVAELARPVSRREMRYVNNFLFAPTGSAAALRDRLDAELSHGRQG